MATTISQEKFERLEDLPLTELAGFLDTTSEALQESYGRPEIAKLQAIEMIKQRVESKMIVVE